MEKNKLIEEITGDKYGCYTIISEPITQIKISATNRLTGKLLFIKKVK